MTLEQLRYLVLLAEERHFTRAAARARIVQPALSRQIRKLEDEVGVALVDRTTRRVRLTEAGERLVARARHVLGEVEAARAELQDIASVITGELRVGITPTPGPIDVAGMLAAFHQRHPGVDLVLREALTVDLAAAVRRDDIDIAIVSAIPPSARPTLDARRLAAEPLVLVVGAGHPLVGCAATTIDELRDERFVAFPAGATLRDTVATAARMAGFEPTVAFETNDIARLRALVGHGLGVAVLPASDANAPGPAVVSLPLEPPLPTYEVYLAWRRTRRLTPAARRFLETATPTIEGC